MTPQRLREQVAWFLGRGFEPLTFSEAMRDPARPSLAVTFDDAYRSVPDLALPVLAKLGVTATVFVPTAEMSAGSLRSWPGIDSWTDTPWETELVGASWEELRPLLAAGWEIGSHTRTHPHLVSLDDRSLSHELRASREDCERATSRPCRSLAYPFGEADHRVATAASKAGYEVAATLADRIPARRDGARDRMLWPRLTMHQQDVAARLRLKSGLFLHGRPIWNAAQTLRRVVR